MTAASRNLINSLKVTFAIYTFAVTAPLLEKFRAEPDFFVTQRISGTMLFAFVTAIGLAVPLVIGILRSLAEKTNHRLGTLVAFTIHWILSTAFILPYITAGKIKTIVALQYGFAGGLVISLLVLLVPVLSKFLAFLAPAAVLFFGLFFADSGIRHSVLGGDSEVKLSSHGNSTPIALLVFDELPLSGLLSPNGQIDDKLFPNFAELAQHSTWYRGAKAVSTHTALALPAILSGKYPNSEKKSPNFRNHPDNLFTLLGASHHPVVLERVSSLCPSDICGDEQRSVISKFSELIMDSLAVYLRILLPRDRTLGIPDINTNWGGFWTKKSGAQNRDDWKRLGRIKLYREMLTRISEPSDKPLLLFAHHLMPHMPYQWTKSLKLYPADEFPAGYVNDSWQGTDWQIRQAYQRFLVQVQAADTILGGYINKLKEVGVWDKALVIVTADHGVTFERNSHRRGNSDSSQFEYDLMSIPFFVKNPGQEVSKISKSLVQSVDILPTIAAAIQADVTWNFDGRPVDSTETAQRQTAKLMIGKKRHQSKLQEENRAYETITLIPNVAPDPLLNWKEKFFGPESFLFGGPFGIAPKESQLKLLAADVTTLPLSNECILKIKLTDPLIVLDNEIHLTKNEEVSAFIQGELQNSCSSTVGLEIDRKIVAISEASQGRGRKVANPNFSVLLPEDLISADKVAKIWGVNGRSRVSTVLMK